MISGSVAVEGGGARPFAGGGAEFLRPLARAPPYARAPPPPLHPHTGAPDSEAASPGSPYPPVHGAYARFLPHFYPYSAAYHQLQTQTHQLSSQTHQLSSQSHQLSSQSHQLSSPGHQLPGQSHQLTSPSHQLPSPNHQLPSPGHQLSSQTHQLSSQTHQLSSQSHQLSSQGHQGASPRQAASPLHAAQPIAPPPPPSPPTRPAPRGKEGSLKHRLLSRERPPPAGRFTRGALIQLGGGQLRRVEDMRTEDFVLSAEQSPELRLVDSTVVRLIRRPATDTVTLTLSYNSNRAKVDMESPVEHPFFVYGQGWASCSPERTLRSYGLQVNRLQVGDVCVSLIPREPQLPPPPLSLHSTHMHPPLHQSNSATIVTTATTTAMTVRPTEAPQRYPENLSLREDSRKRRSSAPDICAEDNVQRPRTMLRH